MSEPKAKVTIISIPEAKSILDTIDPAKADQIQKRTMDYLEKFSKMEAAQAEKRRAALVSEGGLTETEATELVNIMPKTIEEIRVFTAGWKKLIPTETVEKILRILHQQKE